MPMAAMRSIIWQPNLDHNGRGGRAVKAVVPVLSEGFLKQASEPHAFGSFIGALGEGQHLAAFTDPAAAQATATARKGGDILSQILTSHSAREEIALRGSSGTGVSSDTLAKMLPVIASMIFGGLEKSMENQGFGGILGQLSNAAGQGGLGPVLGQILGGGQVSGNPQQPLPAPGPAGGRGGLAPFSARYWAATGVRWVRGNRHRPRRDGPEEGKGGLAVFWRPSWEILLAARELARDWPGGRTRRPRRKSASAGFRCCLDPGGSRSPHQNAAARNPDAHRPAKRH
jgi:hypothetical protein